MSKLYQEDRNKVAVLKFIVLMTVLGLLHMLVTYCTKAEIVKPTPNKPTIQAIDTFTKYGDLPPIYLPPVLDTTDGESWHYQSIKTADQATLDTVVVRQNYGRPTWRWQYDGYPVVEPKDTYYEIRVDKAPDWFWMMYEFKHGYPFAD